MAVRPIDANALHAEISKWPESVMYKDWVQSAIANAPTLTPPNEWVSVEERLPNDKQIVLFHQKDGFIYCAEYFEGNKILSSAWFIDNDSWDAEEVTHWMPLPAPPKG